MIQLAFVPLHGWCSPETVADLLTAHHYLGPSFRGTAWRDTFGALILSPPTSRMLPLHWLDLTRWCLLDRVPNAGSRQWAAVAREAVTRWPDATTVVSYSDPANGHTGALYRACGWLWAPTWHRIRPPPSGGGSWDGVAQESPKDRWVYLLRPDAEREGVLELHDDRLRRDHPEWSYREPRWRKGRPVQGSGGADYRSWRSTQAAA